MDAGAFLKFIVAFDGLIGKAGGITAAEMQQFADFVLRITYPPNPVRNLDGSLKAAPRAVTAPHSPVPFARELERAYVPGPTKIEAAIREVMKG